MGKQVSIQDLKNGITIWSVNLTDEVLTPKKTEILSRPIKDGARLFVLANDGYGPSHRYLGDMGIMGHNQDVRYVFKSGRIANTFARTMQDSALHQTRRQAYEKFQESISEFDGQFDMDFEDNEISDEDYFKEEYSEFIEKLKGQTLHTKNWWNIYLKSDFDFVSVAYPTDIEGFYLLGKKVDSKRLRFDCVVDLNKDNASPEGYYIEVPEQLEFVTFEGGKWYSGWDFISLPNEKLNKSEHPLLGELDFDSEYPLLKEPCFDKPLVE